MTLHHLRQTGLAKLMQKALVKRGYICTRHDALITTNAPGMILDIVIRKEVQPSMH